MYNKMEVVKLYEKVEKEALNLKMKENTLPINWVKDFLNFFNLSLDDLPKLLEFSESLERHKAFVIENKVRFNSLTTKELEIFKLVVNGKKTSEIAKSLFIETNTVSTHRKRIKQKLELETILDWYKYAKAFSIIEF